MPEVVRLTNEQVARMKHFQELGSRFVSQPALRKDEAAIDWARNMVDQAVAENLPTVAYLDLQMAISTFDNEMSLPPHLRS